MAKDGSNERREPEELVGLADLPDADESPEADEWDDAESPLIAVTDEAATPWAFDEADDAPTSTLDSPDLAKPLIAAPESLLTPAPEWQPGAAALAVRPVHADAVDEPVHVDLMEGDEAEAFVPTHSDPQVESPSVLARAAAPAVAVAPAAVASRGGWWTIPTLCGGLAIIACSVIVPQTDANRRMAWEREMLQRDFDAVHKQVEVNEQFLTHVANDPNLAERLAQRQMKVYRQGTAVLDLQRPQKDEMSPFLLTAVMPPEPMAPYQVRSGRLSEIFLNPKHCLYASGAGLLLVAIGLVLGGTTMQSRRHA
jgi:hypothetical protein